MNRLLHSLVIGEIHNEKITEPTLRCIKAMSSLNSVDPTHKTDLLLAGGINTKRIAESYQNIDKVNKIIYSNQKEFAHIFPNPYYSLVNHIYLKNKYTHISSPNTPNGLLILPYIATKLKSCIIPNITKICDSTKYIRYIYAGRVYEEVESTTTPTFLTISSSSFDTVEINSNNKCILEEIECIPSISKLENTKLKKSTEYTQEHTKLNRPTLEKASIIVTGGMGIKDKKNWHLIEDLANNLNNAAIGATRKVVDNGIIEYEYQIGQTGKTVSPQLYIAVGVSGAAQHIAGMRESKIIISINDDKKAPICELSDYVINKDLFDVLPQLIENTKK